VTVHQQHQQQQVGDIDSGRGKAAVAALYFGSTQQFTLAEQSSANSSSAAAFSASAAALPTAIIAQFQPQ
jgi:hypothetical protein